MLNINTLDSFRQKYNPDGSELRHLQLVALKILIEFDRICFKHNIKYILSSGTLLGAIRHGGFIPWDDDVDVEMTRKEYDKFMKIVNVELSIKYEIHSHKDDSYYIAPYIKIRDKESNIVELSKISKVQNKKGIFIDVFVIEKSNIVLFEIARFLQSFFLIKPFRRTILPKWYTKSMYYSLHSILFPLMRYTGKVLPGKYKHCLGVRYRFKRKKEHLEDTIKWNFEGYEFNIPKNYDTYLTGIYGDYMQIPSCKNNHSGILND